MAEVAIPPDPLGMFGLIIQHLESMAKDLPATLPPHRSTKRKRSSQEIQVDSTGKADAAAAESELSVGSIKVGAAEEKAKKKKKSREAKKARKDAEAEAKAEPNSSGSASWFVLHKVPGLKFTIKRVPVTTERTVHSMKEDAGVRDEDDDEDVVSRAKSVDKIDESKLNSDSDSISRPASMLEEAKSSTSASANTSTAKRVLFVPFLDLNMPPSTDDF